MGKNRITFYGWIDHSIETLEEIIEDLKNFYLFYTEEAIQKLVEQKKDVIDNSDALEDTGEIIEYIEYCIKLFKSFIYDLKRLITEIPQGVENRHIDIVNQIYERSCIDDKIQAREFKKEHLQKNMKDESFRPLLSEIYKVSREVFYGNKNLGSLKERLKTFIGTEGLSKEISAPEKNKHDRAALIVPLETPDGANWIDVKIMFLDHKNVEIRVGEKPFGLKHYGALGFRDNRTKPGRPDTLWYLLFLFAEKKGEILRKHIENPKKKISRLRKRLKHLFRINGDPFYPYMKTKLYKVKFGISIRESLSEEMLETSNIEEVRLADIRRKISLVGERNLDWAIKQEIEGGNEKFD